MSSTVYNQKSHFLLVSSETTAIYSPLDTKFSLKNSLEFFYIETISIAMPKNINK